MARFIRYDVKTQTLMPIIREKVKHNINGIESFWNQAKRYVRKFNGVPREYFH